MSFSFLEPHLSRQIATANFAEAKLRHRPLAGYDSATDVVRVLWTAQAASPAVKAELIAALVAESQRPDPAFSAALVLAFRPMLTRLVARAQKMVEDDSLRESMVLEAFLEAVGSCGVPDPEARPSLYLHRETKRRFLLGARRHRRDTARTVLVDRFSDDDIPWEWDQATARGAPQALTTDFDELGELLRVVVCDRLPKDRLDVVEATLLRGEELMAYVDRTFPEETPPKRWRTYCRLQRERHRTIHALRTVLTPWRDEVTAEASASLRLGTDSAFNPNPSATNEVSP